MTNDRRIILHIGTVKTGTTSIQKTLYRSRKQLPDYGLYFPGLGDTFHHNFTFTALFIEDPRILPGFIKKGIVTDPDTAERLRYLKKKLINEIERSGSNDFIVSAENLSLPLFTEDAVENAAKFISNYFDKVTIIIYIRHYNDFLKSEIQQRIKNGHSDMCTEAILNNLMNNPNSGAMYDKAVGKWIRTFCRENVIVRPFDRAAFKNGELIDDFFSHLGFKPESIPINRVLSNESIGKNAVAFLEQYNQKYPMFIDKKANTKRGRSKSYFPVNLLPEDEKFDLDIKFTKEQADTLNNQIDYINSLFADDHQFEHVTYGEGPNIFPTVDEVPSAFYIELINNYSKRAESILDKCDSIENEVSLLRRKLINKANGELLEIYLSCLDSRLTTIKNILLWLKYRILGLPGFDKEFYSRAYSGSAVRVKDPLLHFIVRGVYRCYNPNPDFNTKKYVLEHPEIIASRENALIHYNRNNF